MLDYWTPIKIKQNVGNAGDKVLFIKLIYYYK